MKKVVLISALLGAFAANVFAADTPSDVNQTHSKAHHSKAKADKKHEAKTHKKTKEQTPAQ
ncbi:hypothetical protein FZU82_07900 [Campylobacter jejuni]|uniref:Uncharacterized protein n=1 Tax=Campylobacter jejuni TaxID=197 RepID=A0A5T0LF50_CAMJU|nr:hypothetical protein [Campylobacter jejuni]EAH7346134.1 hypothetical protein [Campylobacter jejuni]EAK0372089.1 hypothetical protein [Campylobacter jejuni]EAK7941659.1 hypothetical protein [Campylobacter jejuni]EAK8629567.1 hypothetical protein [Campylobacter jejuni]EAK8666103.1 hypothetical protein [Campylobacter jejuni]